MSADDGFCGIRDVFNDFLRLFLGSKEKKNVRFQPEIDSCTLLGTKAQIHMQALCAHDVMDKRAIVFSFVGTANRHSRKCLLVQVLGDFDFVLCFSNKKLNRSPRIYKVTPPPPQEFCVYSTVPAR